MTQRSKYLSFGRLPGLITLCLLALVSMPTRGQDLTRLQYNNPGLVVDLGVGLWAWPMPIDWDSDGDYDLIVSCPDKPYSGTYFFENKQGNVKLPVFEPGVRIGKGRKNIRVSYVKGKPRVLDANREYVDFLGKSFDEADVKNLNHPPSVAATKGNQRFNVWSFVDYDGDDVTDVLVGIDDWGYYGWDDGFDEQGHWKRGPLHGLVFLLRNAGSEDEPLYRAALELPTDNVRRINVYGNPMPSMADFDGDGDLDLICGEFLDGFSYFENRGTRSKPVFHAHGYLKHAGAKIRMHVQMITPTALDWDHDGDIDLVVGDEDGRVALVEHLGVKEGMPQFAPPQYFKQRARDLKFGALVTPVGCDWDQDGDEDLVCGNTSGNIAWFENLGGGATPRWDAPKLLEVEGKPFRIMAGENGSIQGPAEAKWGYTTLSVADWDGDGLQDIILNSIWGKIEWLRNIGEPGQPKLSRPKPVRVKWSGEVPKPEWTWWEPSASELVTQWRTTPVAADWDKDGLQDLLVLDPQGYLTMFKREKTADGLWLSPGERVFQGGAYDSRHRPKQGDGFLRLNTGINGGSGRRKLCVTDWNADGVPDLVANSQSANWLQGVQSENGFSFAERGAVSTRILAGHTTSPTTVDWDGDGVRDLVLGAEDGRLYFLKNPHSQD